MVGLPSSSWSFCEHHMIDLPEIDGRSASSQVHLSAAKHVRLTEPQIDSGGTPDRSPLNCFARKGAIAVAHSLVHAMR